MFDKIQIHTLEAPREFMEDVQEFIQLNRHNYYEPKLSIKQRIFKIHPDGYDVTYYSLILELLADAIHKIMDLKMIQDKSITIISNRRIYFCSQYPVDRMGYSEFDRITNDRYVKAWIIDNDYTNILIFNFGDYEVRTGFLSGLNNRQIQDYHHPLDKEFPHTCYQCGKDLKFRELCAANHNLDDKTLSKMWKSQHVEFYCCSCYRKQRDEEYRKVNMVI